MNALVEAMKATSRPLRRWVRRPWRHETAQLYEFSHNSLWIRENLDPYVKQIRAITGSSAVFAPPGWLHEFFADDEDLCQKFAESLSGRRLLEIGPGPLPAIAYFPKAALRVAIDPLIAKYSAEIARVFGDDPVFSGIHQHSQNAEIFHPEYAGKINGAIVCRNALDHLEHPEFVLSNLASYAAPGCALLLWSDLFHLDGCDDGHRDITRDVESFARLISNLGFDIVRRSPPVDGRNTIAFGCFATRRQS